MGLSAWREALPAMFFRFDFSSNMVAGEIAFAAEGLSRKVGGAIPDAATFADEFTAATVDAIRHRLIGGINWSADRYSTPDRELRRAGRFGLVLRFSGPGFDLAKGYLVQCAVTSSAFPFREADLDDLTAEDGAIRACGSLAEKTPEAYLMLAAPRQLKLLKADVVAKADRVTFPELYHQDVAGFLHRALMGWSGEAELAATDPAAIDRLISEYGLSHLVSLHGRDIRED